MLCAAGGLAALLLLGAVVMLLVAGGNARSRVQTLASEALGMEVVVAGAVQIKLLPSLHLSLEDVHIRNRGAQIAVAAQADLGLEVLALLRNEVRMNRVALKQVKITIERQRDGRFNFETAPRAGGAALPALVDNVVLSDAALVYVDSQTGKRIEADACEVDAHHLQLSTKPGATRLKGLSFTGALACAQVSANGLVLSGVKASVAGNEGVFDFKPITMRVFDGEGTGDLHADLSGEVPAYRVSYSVSKFQLAQFFKAVSPSQAGSGLMDFSATLAMKGKTAQDMLRSAGGEAALRGRDLTLDIGDIDAAFSRYEATQTFNLFDVGAVFFAGPLGLVVTRGYSLANALKGSGGNTRVGTLVSTWGIERGVAQAKDVAMATAENRVALKGELDLAGERFKEVTVALVDAKGCVKVRQQIRGPFNKPEVEKPNLLTSLAGPVRGLLNKAEELIGGQCDVFYAGSVAAPR